METDTAVETDTAMRFLDWPESVALGAAVAVTTRHGGVSEGAHGSLNLALHVGDDPGKVIANRERAARAFGVELDDLIFAEQVHGAGSAVVGTPERGRGTRAMDDAISSADILVTTALDATLAILVADCVPIALLDPEARRAGRGPRRLARHRRTGEHPRPRGDEHAGRPARARHRLHRSRAPIRRTTRSTWRSIGRWRRRSTPIPFLPEVARSDGPDHWKVDLMAANRQQLVLAGVTHGHILDCGVTTADDDYFSDRAARPCGRFALLARLTGSDGRP